MKTTRLGGRRYAAAVLLPLLLTTTTTTKTTTTRITFVAAGTVSVAAAAFSPCYRTLTRSSVTRGQEGAASSSSSSSSSLSSSLSSRIPQQQRPQPRLPRLLRLPRPPRNPHFMLPLHRSSHGGGGGGDGNGSGDGNAGGSSGGRIGRSDSMRLGAVPPAVAAAAAALTTTTTTMTTEALGTTAAEDVPTMAAAAAAATAVVSRPDLLEREILTDLIEFLDPINQALAEQFQTSLSKLLGTLSEMGTLLENPFDAMADGGVGIGIGDDHEGAERLLSLLANGAGQLADLSQTIQEAYPVLGDIADGLRDVFEAAAADHADGNGNDLVERISSLASSFSSLEGMNSGTTMTTISTMMGEGNAFLVIFLSSVITYAFVARLLTSWSSSSSSSSSPPPLRPYPLGKYDPDTARAYFDSNGRILRVAARAIQVAQKSLGFGLNLLQDKLRDQVEANSDRRGIELARLLTQLGPSFIKIGQSLSIRTDLLSPSYVRGLATLQDQVPAFPSKIAYEMLRYEWDVADLDDVVSSISEEPVAAASLGQVYRATLRSDPPPSFRRHGINDDDIHDDDIHDDVWGLSGKHESNRRDDDDDDHNNNNNNDNGGGGGGGSSRRPLEVAIKVQRPQIMDQIALDMHLLRELAPIVKGVFNLNSDTVGTVDAWGKGFVDELDYVMEANNARIFAESIESTPLSDVVLAPRSVEALTTDRILVTEWIDGQRLDRSTQSDVTVLCSVAMNTYLTMMLETGLLHADPHPGNLLRTPEGKLCILDWGMVTRLGPDLQLTLIEHMAHLTSRDYAEIPRDLLRLGFIPPSKADLIEDSGIVQVLAEIYGAWTEGGGAAAINVNRVVDQLQDLTATRGNLFQIPPYFAYIAKSFSVLEGIGLSNDPTYSIINECLPYVSKRLLTDQSERAGGALSTFIFGPDKNDLDGRIVDYDRVEQLVTGFGNYTTSASGALLGRPDRSRARLLEGAAESVLDLVFSEDETPLQTILLEQLAKIVTSTSRLVWAEMRARSGTLPSGRSVLGTVLDPLGLWRTSPLVRVNHLDDRTVATTRKLVALAQGQLDVPQQQQQQRQQQQQQPWGVNGNSNGNNNDGGRNDAAFDLTTMSREEAAELTVIMVRKVWERRSGVLKTGGRFARELLTITARKLERGERDGDVTRSDEDGHGAAEHDVPSPFTPTAAAAIAAMGTGTGTLASTKPESSRLSNARMRLMELEQEPYM